VKYGSASLGLDSGEGALLHLFDREAICIEQRAALSSASRKLIVVPSISGHQLAM
jgi:hypothetical protein